MSEAGERLKTARKWRGLTQAELADESGVGVTVIRHLEQGVRATARMERGGSWLTRSKYPQCASPRGRTTPE
ncbi:helix-turn-helix domain-containing protein [Streptomyces sp. NPDC056084]|uniref:helix-turn-helix domain-containing protein n=1 Tax=unclassified Streptomyces TaxID=2593676 RepID=UPI0035E23721